MFDFRSMNDSYRRILPLCTYISLYYNFFLRRAPVLAPTHELSRQLASPTKALLHIFKLRVLCASRANAPSNPRASGTTAKMATAMAALSIAGEAGSEFQVRQGTERARVVDVMASTPNKVLEMTRGRGWNWDERLEAKPRKEVSMWRDVNLDATRKSFYTVDTAEDRVLSSRILSTPGEDLLPCVVLVLEGCAYDLVPRLALLQVGLPLRLADPICLACKQEREECWEHGYKEPPRGSDYSGTTSSSS
ncbi:hypothetical protein FIBSPDRAFT_944567 [Athelia psychrophila]|uniref:Uncharacterized protein n=1 Tax=Athelia psychrophila TaxID=1759441 RepID=A0A166US87_9AGAM|nr:hypothetical protein FIBSPDRAFT_944567 [Fibularhizoctonia sp. CBS 109695]